jgi:hypothetical protein
MPKRSSPRRLRRNAGKKLKQQEIEIEFLKRCIGRVTGKKPPEPGAGR